MNSNQKPTRDASHYQTYGALLHALGDWASVLENFPYGLGALMFNYLLYQSQLIPRWISIWGLLGATLLVAMGLLRLFGQSAILLAIPLILNELVLAVWLIARGFTSPAIASAVVGVLFIAALGSSMLSGNFLGSTKKPDYLTAVAANEKQVLIGVLLMVALTASVVSIPIVMFPILKEYNESLALMYVAARGFEGFFDIAIAVSLLLLLTLSREFVKAGTPTAKAGINETS